MWVSSLIKKRAPKTISIEEGSETYDPQGCEPQALGAPKTISIEEGSEIYITYDDMVKQNTLDNSDASQFELSMQEKDGIYVEAKR